MKETFDLPLKDLSNSHKRLLQGIPGQALTKLNPKQENATECTKTNWKSLHRPLLQTVP